MSQTIRCSNEIEGIKIRCGETVNEVRVANFADDTQLFHRSEKSIKASFKILKTYSNASGAKLNMKKTKGLYIGSWKEKEPIFKEIKWARNVTGLGTVFGYNINYEDLWMKKFAKFKDIIKKWTKRELTVFGKKILINSYIMSSMSYLTEIYTANIPDNFITETNALIRDFLWEAKTWKVAQKTVALRKQHGGLEIPDIASFIQARKVKWILKIKYSPTNRWNMLGKKHLKKFDKKFGLEYFILKCSNLKNSRLENMPKFYRVCLQAWSNFISKNKVETQEDILGQYLFGNNSILFNKEPLLLTHWTKSSIQRIQDIWDIENNRWLCGTAIFNQLTKKQIGWLNTKK
jgi:hypothetical protein